MFPIIFNGHPSVCYPPRFIYGKSLYWLWKMLQPARTKKKSINNLEAVNSVGGLTLRGLLTIAWQLSVTGVMSLAETYVNIYGKSPGPGLKGVGTEERIWTRCNDARKVVRKGSMHLQNRGTCCYMRLFNHIIVTIFLRQKNIKTVHLQFAQKNTLPNGEQNPSWKNARVRPRNSTCACYLNQIRGKKMTRVALPSSCGLGTS